MSEPAPLTDAGSTQLTDAQKRAAVTRIHENIALRSGAGCGKTFVLARRFTELLAAEGASADVLSRWVALTFTDKAALEMAQRVRNLLTGFAAKAKGNDKRLLLGWIQSLDQARISTIHSFCASLLRAGAIEAGIDPAFAVCSDELLAAQMTAEAADQAVLEAVEQQNAAVAELLAAMSLDRLIDMARDLVSRRTAADLTAYGDAGAILSRWKKLADGQRRQAWQTLQSDTNLAQRIKELQAACAAVGGNDKLAAFIREKLTVAQSIIANPDAATPKMFQQLTEKPGNLGSAKAWGSDKAVKEARLSIKDVDELIGQYGLYAERLGPLDEQAAAALATLSRLALRADELYRAAKRAKGLLDFDDLLIHTERLLASHPDLCRALGDGIGQLLIDECQDTDAFQVRLLERLIRGGVESGALPDGKLFLVGDAKQSIYRFRGAQVEVFQDWCRRLGAGKQEDLDLSFRTHAAAAAFVNHLFAPLMGQDYAPIQANRRDGPPQACVEILLAEGVDGEPIKGADQAEAAQAAAVAERIERMIQDGETRVWDAKSKTWRAVRAGDIAILMARMTAGLEYERELARRGIPYYVVAGSGFFKQQEVFDVLNALRAIDHPFDDIALFGVLRSSLFGLDDNALARIAQAAQPPYWPALSAGTLPEGLEASMRGSLLRAIETIGRLHRDKDALGIDRLIETVLSATNYEATLLAQPQGKRMLGNVRVLADQARAASREGLALADFLERMDELVVHESRYEQAAVAGEAENVVRIMTIHKAKGLEFPVVVVPDLNARRRGETSPILGRSDWGLVFRLKADSADEQEDENSEGEDESPGEAELPLSYRLAKAMEDCDQDQEDIRKLYVAVTRAQDHLILVGANWRTKEGNIKWKGSFLDRIDGVLGIRTAVDDGRRTIPYGDGQFQADLRVVTPSAADERSSKRSAGWKMLQAAKTGQDLTQRILASAPAAAAALPLLGPLPPDVARTELAVTALADFAACPMLYRWHHELRVPEAMLPPNPSQAKQQKAKQGRTAAMDPATLGTLLHRCMELLDFAHPQPARALVTAAACQLHLEEAADLDAVAEEFGAMLDRLAAQPLWASLASAQATLRELDFTSSVGPAVLRGQIDLLYQDAGGAWRIVDYKSDRVDAAGVEEHARRYELQILAYAAAAARHLGQPPVEAVLYFLRPGLAYTLSITKASLAAAEQRLTETARQLVAARRSGCFQRRDGRHCAICPYGPLCERCEPAAY
ncbi:MAG: UvrD-helicase domain-containing protein [Phycisphaerae bacterium]